eukprot:CAMPEP_0114284006 /NCGR_PEP_ID=MMETSP0059-20121206/4418_1 /TAXON_ID=36894 /ORGANISM="Pyramimonas parkeae, Strain CCMP726" /LENGTH=246 /DNA_ID=CAMNT_0001404799 /DNA_START=66 /DNA_END=806 /DNA_ORIENTATION=-
MTSSNAFASSVHPNSGNCITDRSSTRVRHAPGGSSSFSFGWEEPLPAAVPVPDVEPAEVVASPGRVDALEARLREMGKAATAAALEPIPVYMSEPEVAAETPVASTMETKEVAVVSMEESVAETVCTEGDLQKMTLSEVRTLLRERNINPGGSKGALIERYFDAVKSGDCKPKMVLPVTQSKENYNVNNYARPDGQNTGNFMTDRNSSRVLAPPGGGSTFSFGDETQPVYAPSRGRTPGGGSSIVF